ncbi:hypothetical protein MBM_07019 [Drepanopeziza brunnea f. sp. 'multigermtubi' MB_m1]|uniref:Uncharacterized protein n=1 Tax=Marssonina brunnea f. sp. multigermtubi (strain MB_m1) TaxID=1072389 RepID=K1X1X6_MARBU|nr:uncharacterized protein MBM_07019 [Drepanopeziza brunnea f. sp. 'multigermtubi' MB_m1]EKD14808.1 hypothetical protein MBM_07019 [Drepanopeziza brunnea f. sp. 'multigermtubi' MB_m1]
MPLNYHSENNDSATARKRRRRLREGSYRHRVCLWHRARNRSSLPRPSYLDSSNLLPKILLLPRYYEDGVSAILPVIQYAKIDDQRDHERCHFRRGDLLPGGECDQAIRICVSKLGAHAHDPRRPPLHEKQAARLHHQRGPQNCRCRYRPGLHDEPAWPARRDEAYGAVVIDRELQIEHRNITPHIFHQGHLSRQPPPIVERPRPATKARAQAATVVGREERGGSEEPGLEVDGGGEIGVDLSVDGGVEAARDWGLEGDVGGGGDACEECKEMAYTTRSRCWDTWVLSYSWAIGKGVHEFASVDQVGGASRESGKRGAGACSTLKAALHFELNLLLCGESGRCWFWQVRVHC